MSERLDKLERQLATIANFELQHSSLPYNRWFTIVRLYRCLDGHVGHIKTGTYNGTHLCPQPCGQPAFVTFPEDTTGELDHAAIIGAR